MNFAQKFGIFCLIVISVCYVYFSFFNKDGFEFFKFRDNHEGELNYYPEWQSEEEPKTDENSKNDDVKVIKIFVTDSKGNLRSVNRNCNTAVEKSCFEFAIKQLVSSPTKWEKSKGLSSEIPSGTKVLSVRESNNNILVDLSPAFESGGGAESTYIRVHQLIKTANANTKLPVYLYINGKQADVIGGEGIMVKQPLNERSLDD